VGIEFITNYQTMGTPNWGRLFQEGRCKAIGVPFSDEELHAIHKEGVIPKDIQSGKWMPEVKVEKSEIAGDIKQIMKQMRQTLREKGIGFSNADSLEKLQERLSKAI